jgi:PAS domain S-box-containing protein
MIVNDSKTSLKGFASYLLNHRLEEATHRYLHILQEVEVPLLKLFAHLSDQELFTLIKDSLASFLQQICDDNFMPLAIKALEQWQENQLPGIQKQEVQASDLIYSYTARKYLFMDFLAEHTTDLTAGINILKELESMFAEIQTISINTYSTIQKQEAEERKNFAELLIHNSSDAIVAYNTDNIITVWNEAMERRTGIPAKEAISKGIFEVYSGLSNKQEALAQQSVWKGKITQLNELNNNDRTEFYNIKFSPVFYNDKIIGGVNFIQDISEVKQKERNLLEFQEELQTMNEELQESREEYMAANEELTESHEKLIESLDKINQQYNQVLKLKEELKLSESKYRLLALNATDIITAYAEDGTYSYVSDSVRDVLGLVPEELIGQDPQKLVHPDDVATIQATTLKLLEENKPQKVEFRILAKNNQYRWMETYARLVKDPDHPDKRELQASTRDIHERKEAELALAKERNYFFTILENIKEGIVACNKDGEITYTNLSSLNLDKARSNKIPISDWISFFNILHADGTALSTAEELPLARALRGETIKDVHLVAMVAEGEYRHLACNAQQLVNPDGTANGAILVTRDITENIKTEKQLQEQHKALQTAYSELQETKAALQKAYTDLESKVIARTRSLQEASNKVKDRELLLDSVINATPALISYITRESKYELVNKSYLDWFQVSESDLVGTNVIDFMKNRVHHHPGKAVFEGALAGNKQKFEIDLQHNDGTWRQVDVQYIPHVLENGDIPGFVALIIDVSTIVKSQKELEEKNKQLQKINIDLDNFVYTASHDLKAPISNIEGLFNQLNKRMSHTFGDTEHLIVKMVHNSIQKFRTTIQYLTEISRLDHELDAYKEELLFRQIIEDVLFDISPLIAEANPKITLELDEETVWYTQKNLRSIIYNLISNSVKYRSSERPLEITIKTYLQEGRTAFELHDNGLGMDEQQLSKLFAMFRRFHNHVEGTGVGLFIIKRIIENYGGTIEVSSIPDKGSTFKVVF